MICFQVGKTSKAKTPSDDFKVITPKNPLLSQQMITSKVDTVICFQVGKTSKAKTSSDDFKVTTPKNPLLSQQAITSKGIIVPYTNLQLNPYLNTQLDLFCSNNLSFSMHGS